jgi:hypothetical protein
VVPEVKPRAAELLAQLDRFLQWDLVTVTPWGAPSISPVGARVVPDEATIWTSTTVGYAAKLRNIRAQPRVALLRAHPDEPPMLLRGEARIVGGDGTANLAQLFRLMGGAGGARRHFATTAFDPFWRRLYRAYWRRVLIAVRIVEVSTLGDRGWRPVRLSSWSGEKLAGSGVRPPRRAGSPSRLLDSRGRAMIEEGAPTVLATVRHIGAFPTAWPVSARPEAQGIRVDAGFELPEGRLPCSSLAVRVVDDTFETARMVGWIGSLEAGSGRRLLVPRATYGFAKPPGVLGDLAAGVAALYRESTLDHPAEVSSPDVGEAAGRVGAGKPPGITLAPEAWRSLEELFARRNAAAPWYAGMAALVPERRLAERLSRLGERAQLERDWAHGLLTRGSRRVGMGWLVSGAMAFRPNPARPQETARREERVVAALLLRLERQLPEGLGRAPARSGRGAQPGPAAVATLGRESGLAEAALSAANAVAAAFDRLSPLGRRR